jgi:imidazole glycerol-phosphate synthase subunit HisF
MLTKRIIACLDIKNSRTVKGCNFKDLKDAGDPIELAKKYVDDGIDELVFLDISATEEERSTFIPLVSAIANEINVPFSVGGGINSKKTAHQLLRNGADKVSINSSAIANPGLINDIAEIFGTQSVIVAIDAKCVDGLWMVYSHGGSKPTGLSLFDWAHKAEKLGAGEILFTSIDHDGVKKGYAIEALSELNTIITIPVIASGGAGQKEHFFDVFYYGMADAALASSVFHYGEVGIESLKVYLKNKDLPIRL